MVSESSDLKHFGPVQAKTGQAVNYTSQKASDVYTTAKQYVPESVQPRLKVIEDKVAEYGTPAVTAVQDTSGRVLQIADTKFEEAANGVFSLHDKHYPQFEKAKDQYLSKVEGTISSIRQTGVRGAYDHVAKGTTGVVEDVKKLPNKLNKLTETSLDVVEDYINYATTRPTVQKLWGSAKPSADWTWKTYLSIHDVLVSQPLYAKVYGIGEKVVETTTNTGVYKSTAPLVWSTIAPVAEPVLTKIQKTDAYKVAVDQLQPISAA